jgi:hypothetical protein
MAHPILEALAEIFGDRVISRGLWPPCSLELTSFDSHLWGNLKEKMYKTNPHTLGEPRNHIRRHISVISG